MGPKLDEVDEELLLAELQRRGWRFKETRIPVGCDGPAREGEPYIHARQLQHTRRVEPEGTS